MEAWYATALDVDGSLSRAVVSHVHVFVADVVKSFDTVDRRILDRVLSSLGLLGRFGHVYFEYHAHVRLTVLSLLLVWMIHGPGKEASRKDAP